VPRILLSALPYCLMRCATTLAAPAVDDARQVQPLRPGDDAPAFTVRRPDGSDFDFDSTGRQDPAVLIFYRGGWCPYCNAHLAELRHVVPRLAERGYEVLFLSADRPERLRDSLDVEVPEYTLLSDSRMVAARAYGIAFRVDDETYQRYRSLGLDLETTSGENHHELPVPAVFVVDRKGVIRYVYANPDYKVRISAAELERAVESLDRPGGI
jgi:peroxiredoxin